MSIQNNIECSICYNKFVKSEEEVQKNNNLIKNLINELKNINREDDDKYNNISKNISKLSCLDISRYNESYYCSTPNCKCAICAYYLDKIKNKDGIGEDFLYKFICPYYKQFDIKEYMKKVHDELQRKVLDEETFVEILLKKLHIEDFKFNYS